MSDDTRQGEPSGEQPPATAVGDSDVRADGRVAGWWGRAASLADRGEAWLERQDPASHTGATIGWFRRYQATDGQLYAVLLGAYFLLTVVPALLVDASYLYSDPAALASRIEHRLGLSGTTAVQFHSVFVGAREHHLGVLVLALVNLAFFGLGFARVLQLVHARSWGIELRKNAVRDQARYLTVLIAVLVMSFLYVLQTRQLRGEPAWIGWLLAVGWLVLLVGFFVWAPRLLLYGRVDARLLLPGALFTIAGLIALRLVSSLVLTRWLTSYSNSYGALGIVMAVLYWIILIGTILVLAATLSPAFAERRHLLKGNSSPASS